MKKALITGVTGQDGSYLAEFLLEKGYEVHGIKRRASSFNTERIDHLYQDPHESNKNLMLHYGDLTDSTNLIRILQEVQPDEIYNLGAQSHVAVSFETPEYTANSDALGTIRMLEAIRTLDMVQKVKFYQASTSEMFGKHGKKKQNELTNFHPRSPYATSKTFSHYTVQNYREAYKMFSVNGILFNHESPLRGEEFITRKISLGLAKIVTGKQKVLKVGNIYAKRDWGYAKDYIEAMWKMLQVKKPEDFVIATGKTHSVKEFINKCIKILKINTKWVGKGLNEKLIDLNRNKPIIVIDKKYFRPAEVNVLKGDYTRAKKILKWSPKTNIDDLAKIMIMSDLLYVNKK